MTLDYRRLPQHIAIIMDGNGRWAQKRLLARNEGHRIGVETVDDIVTHCRDLGVHYLTLYAFSMENWSRPSDETAALMALLIHFLSSKREKMVKNEIRFETIGDIARLPADVKHEIAITKEATVSMNKMVLTLALSYSARDEIMRAINTILKEKASGKYKDDFISMERFASYLDTADMPDPDLIIRTSGEMRISNFLLWQAAYSELVFTDTLWPDFDIKALEAAICEYQSRERRFGKISAQVRKEGG